MILLTQPGGEGRVTERESMSKEEAMDQKRRKTAFFACGLKNGLQKGFA